MTPVLPPRPGDLHESKAMERLLPRPPPKPVSTDAEALKKIADIMNGGIP